MRWRVSLRWRLALVLVGFTAAVLLVQDIPLAGYLRDVERDRVTAGLQQDAFTLAGRSVVVLAAGNAPDAALQGPVHDYASSTGARVVITDAAGREVISSDGTSGEAYADLTGVSQALAGRATTGLTVDPRSSRQELYVAVPVRAGTDILGTVRLTYPATDLDSAVTGRVRGLTVVGLLTLLAAALIAFLVASAVTRRLRRLRHAAEDLAAGDLTSRAGTGGASELDALSRSFNAMAERIEDLVTAQRGFAADASHQLRTPLTALRLRIEQAGDDVERDPRTARSTLEAALAEADRLQHLIDGLLLLARSEGARPAVVRTDLCAVVRERVDAWEPLAEERQVAVTAQAPGRCVVWAVAGAVEQIVDNYVDNALEVTPPGGYVRIQVRVAAGELTVQDSGPGMSGADRARAFDRFWRGDSQRSGSGLGLAIVRSLAQASGATVSLEQAPDGGIRALARFRRAAAETPSLVPGSGPPMGRDAVAAGPTASRPEPPRD